jgi:beta-glucosidase
VIQATIDGEGWVADVEKLISELTLDEKAALTAGEDMWSTPAVDRLGVPKILMSDGPNGARGPDLVGGSPALCVPCGSALGATWDPVLIEQVATAVGEDARGKGIRVLLAPTVNIHRSPLYGRNFECYSEDPVLSGSIAAAFVRGAQSRGVITTVKHFVGNEAEYQRQTSNSVIDDRALREIYLRPFEMAVKEGGALGVMTSYNRVNGRWCSEQPELLAGILRQEWGFEGFVVTDWFATTGTVDSARAGLDLEMPGPGRSFGTALAGAVRAGELPEAVIDGQVRHLLEALEKVGALDGSGPAPPNGDRPEHRRIARTAAAASMVLLRNEDAVLPIDRGRVRRIAVIGPGANRPQIHGGGSAALVSFPGPTPLDALRSACGPDVEVLHERGCDIDKTTPVLPIDMELSFYGGHRLAGPALATRQASEARLMFFGSPAPGVPQDFSGRATGTFVADEDGDWTFSLVQAGRARLVLDRGIVLDGFTDPPPPGEGIFGLGSREMFGKVSLKAGQPVPVVVEFSNEESTVLTAVTVGCRRPERADLMERAVEAARGADLAVVVVGTTADWETEGRDRASMDLPRGQDGLIRAVAAANSRTVVVVNAGSPVTMPWAEDVPAVLMGWFGGQEFGAALAEVLTGAVDPGGRLPTTMPLRLEHNPSFGNFPGENGSVRYGESLLVGYRWYDTRSLAVRFPFGHGLSYTTFAMGEPVCSSCTFRRGDRLTVTVPVSNSGDRPGSEVVQCYVEQVAPRLDRPRKELAAFAKINLPAGLSSTVEMTLDDRSFAYWDPGQPDWAAVTARAGLAATGLGGPPPEPGWFVAPGSYRLHIGRSVADITHVVDIEVVE